MKRFFGISCLALLSACATDMDALVYDDAASVPVVYAKAETVPVESTDDAADDPAIWINASDPASSYILGTDKQAGLGIYTLSGAIQQFIPAGRLNNVDLRQGVTVGLWEGDLAAATNRTDDSVTLFTVDGEGANVFGSFAAELPEPYGMCMGQVGRDLIVFITYKTGEVDAHKLLSANGNETLQERIGRIKFDTQLEGCVVDDATDTLYIGEEMRGVWKTSVASSIDGLKYTPPVLIDEIDGATGITGDVEGVALYKSDAASYLVISSQGNDSYAVYDLDGDNNFRGRFRIAASEETGIDGAQETDGIAISSAPLGPDYPEGVLVAQDGFNRGATQNFKIVDWRDVKAALGLE
ncbi:phytase [Aquisalinus flavus]|uniref:BPP domain-containing protein n=1 Tax=Aquisalinus flavus TaxID=1526572 RepID=A0A8J2V698_9PROT|nr:phytase [Aquisalinus flavus]MBD0427550.1 phytase [Aquisalinus flavus]GGD01841.1 hypothetical protein GCM10011342_08630 [Aquisalinus flavus]